MSSEALLQWRQAAAESTQGISSDDIYEMIGRAITTHDLRGRALDYGAGVGNLTARLARLSRFPEIRGADILPAPENMASRWIQQDLNDVIVGFDEYFDVVIASEVIEHLENPRHTVRELAKVCRPGGHVIITTPNNESVRSLLALAIRGHFVHFDKGWYPGHITPVLRKDLSRMFNEAGLQLLGFDYTRFGALPGRPTQTWQKYSLGFLKGLRFSDNLLAIGRKPSR